MIVNPQFSTWGPEKKQLLELVRQAPGKYVTEIGCFRGNTSRILAQECRNLGKELICIDPWDNRQDCADESIYFEFLENTSEFKDVLHVIRADSFSAKEYLPEDYSDQCGLVFVDGDHSYEGTLQDLNLYYPFLISEGIMVIHDVFDSGWAGVSKAVEEFKFSGSIYYFKYKPSKPEVLKYQHGVSGLAWFFKDSSKS